MLRSRGLRLGVDPGADLGEQGGRAGTSLLPTHAPPRSARLQADRHVLGHREVGEERGLLVDGGDAQGPRPPRGVVGDGLALEADFPAVRSYGSRDDLDQGGLAGAVLAHEGMDLARPQLERGPAQRVHAGVGLRQAPRVEQEVVRGRHQENPAPW